MVERFDMKTAFYSFFLLANLAANAQTILQPSEVVQGQPLRSPIFYADDLTNSIELLTVNNYDVFATEVYASSINGAQETIYSDTLQFEERIDTLWNFELRQHYYNHGIASGEVLIMSGLTHRTAGPFRPVSVCAGVGYSPHYGWFGENIQPMNWVFSPDEIEYDQFDPRYVSYSMSEHPWIDGPVLVGAFNNIEENNYSMEVYDIYPEEMLPTNLRVSLPLEEILYINHSNVVDRKLLISGFETNSTTSFIKHAKAFLVDLENQTWQELDFEQNGNSSEIIAGLVDENGINYLIVQERSISGIIMNSRIIRYDGEESVIASFGSGFVPTSIIRKTNHGLLLGGDYDRSGLMTAAVFEVEENQGLKRMIGFADLGDIETRFKAYDETILGDMIVGSYDSLNGSRPGSFATPITFGSLLSVPEPEKETSLISLAGAELNFLLSGTNNFEVVDALGRTQMSGQTQKRMVDLSGMKSGVYVVSVWNEDKRESIKTVLAGQ